MCELSREQFYNVSDLVRPDNENDDLTFVFFRLMIQSLF